jgi:hypothetical protein
LVSSKVDQKKAIVGAVGAVKLEEEEEEEAA